MYGNNKFVSERLTAYESGFRSSLKRNLYLDIAVFYNAYDDLSSYQVGGFFLEPTSTPVHAVLPLVTSNGIKGRGYGVEVAPDWKPVPWWELKVSYFVLWTCIGQKTSPAAMTRPVSSIMRDRALATRRCSSPRSTCPSDPNSTRPTRRSPLSPAQSSNTVSPVTTVTGYETADARLGYHITRQLEVSIDGQNLLQPHHAEFGGDPGVLVGIKRCVYAKLTWESQSK